MTKEKKKIELKTSLPSHNLVFLFPVSSHFTWILETHSTSKYASLRWNFCWELSLNQIGTRKCRHIEQNWTQYGRHERKKLFFIRISENLFPFQSPRAVPTFSFTNYLRTQIRPSVLVHISRAWLQNPRFVFLANSSPKLFVSLSISTSSNLSNLFLIIISLQTYTTYAISQLPDVPDHKWIKIPRKVAFCPR